MYWSTGCVADSEQRAESTGSTSQLWSTNSGTQPLTISCGFPAPYLAISPRGPPVLLTRREVPLLLSLKVPPIGGARGWSLESGVTSVTGVTNNFIYMILKVFFGCYIAFISTCR